MGLEKKFKPNHPNLIVLFELKLEILVEILLPNNGKMEVLK